MKMEIAATGSATYCPEDDKLRLYVGRVPRDEYEALRAEGWTSTPKQSCDFVATWTPTREDTALMYGDGEIEDEDQSPADRAADRAERFAGYREKREGEAHERADAYDAGPQIHGYQNAALAERRAAGHDRLAARAVNAWDKAEYWQRRTAGVIGHALYVSAPGVRMGRIKKIEAELRGIEKTHAERRQRWEWWNGCAKEQDEAKKNALALKLAYIEHGDYTHPRTGRKSYLFDLAQVEETGLRPDPLNGAELCALWLANNPEPSEKPAGRWHRHLTLRIEYENQMLEAQGGRLAAVDMVPGGWLGKRQIQKVNKSPATGRVVSVQVIDPRSATCDRWGNAYPDGVVGKPRMLQIDTERLPPDAYRAPTEEELREFEQARKAEKKAKAETTPKGPPLVNPTDEDAERLQAVWNEIAAADFARRHGAANAKYYTADAPRTVQRITQAQYSANSGGTYSKCETVDVMQGGAVLLNAYWAKSKPHLPVVAKVRAFHGSVIVLTDKHQKALPAAVWEKVTETVDKTTVAA